MIALTNHVQYKNGDTYIHPSFRYAGTGFLINEKGKNYAVTAKHILWIARNKKRKTVELRNELSRWVMKPKIGSADSLVVDRLLNEDSTEILEGPASSILERDILVFSLKSTTSAICALVPRYSKLNPGEKVYLIGNAYSDPSTEIYESRVVRKLGMDILLEQVGDNLSGFSGSPVIDENGYLIGVFSSTSSEPVTGKGVIVAVSTEYLKKAMRSKAGLNTPKEDYGKLILDEALNSGAHAAIAKYNKLIGNPRNYFKYNLRSANRNGLLEVGETLLKTNKTDDAIEILKLNVKVNSGFYKNYNVLAKAYLAGGRKEEAIEYFKISLIKFNSKEENEAYQELVQLGVY